MSSVSAVGGICAISGLTGRIAVNRMGTQLDADRITGWKQTPIPAPPPARGVPMGHTRGPAREGPAPPPARDVPTGHTRTARRGTSDSASTPLPFLNLRSVNTERAEARGHGGGWGEDVVPIAQ